MAQPQSERTALYSACRVGDEARVRQLLEARDGFISVDTDGLGSALHKAVGPGHLAIIELLLDFEAPVDYKSNNGSTPLHRAAELGHSEIVRVLLENGATPGLRNEDGKAPIAVSKTPTIRRLIADEVSLRQAGGGHEGGNRRPERPSRPPAPAPAEDPPRPDPPTALAPAITPPMPLPKAKAPPSPAPKARTPLGDIQKNRPMPTRESPQHKIQAPSPSRSSRLDFDELELTCRVCLRAFCSEDGSDPVSLPCGHTFCTTCVSALQGAGRAFRCPLDRQVYSRKLELHTNTVLRDLIHRLPKLMGAAAASQGAGVAGAGVRTPARGGGGGGAGRKGAHAEEPTASGGAGAASPTSSGEGGCSVDDEGAGTTPASKAKGGAGSGVAKGGKAWGTGLLVDAATSPFTPGDINGTGRRTAAGGEGGGAPMEVPPFSLVE